MKANPWKRRDKIISKFTRRTVVTPGILPVNGSHHFKILTNWPCYLPLLKWQVSRSGEGYKERFPRTQRQCLWNWFSHFQWENTEETLEITFQPYMRPDFATPVLVFPRNDWRASREIPPWWHVIAHFRLVLKWRKTPPPPPRLIVRHPGRVSVEPPQLLLGI